jgi:phenylalanyl-tRNA synthetase beta chain
VKVLLSWLREFAPFEGDPVALGDQMSDLGMAVESIEHVGQGLDGIVVARVLDLRRHPDAERIQLVDVDIGDGEALQICCGAFNMAVGDLVPLATLGTTMPDGLRIERRKLRGQWSNGMLCSARELGLGEDHGGIWILDGGAARPSGGERTSAGQDLRSALGIEADVLYDLEVNPNRPDALSVAGVARDLAARVGVPFAHREVVVAESGPSVPGQASAEIVDRDLCGRFLARVLHGVTVGTSPAWLANRLTRLGMRPINSVVDVSNYVMLELGQPNHTYDLDTVPGGALRIRRARAGEVVRTLDGVDRSLDAGDGVIADRDDAAIGIAGVMGGASTEISAGTSSVLLEMAWWDPMSIARTSARLGLRSEASIRFERGADPEISERAALRFAELLAASAPGTALAPGTVDERGRLPDRGPVRVRTDRVNAYLGTALTDADIRGLLEPIGFAVKPEAAGVQDVIVPSFRPDTTTETDVIEEVARHHGYGRIARTVPPAVGAGGLTPYQAARREVRQVMVGLGVDEAMPLPFLAPADVERAGLPDDVVTVTNPLDADESVLRPSLLPGLLKAVAYNASHRNPGVRLFEVGKTFGRPAPGEPLPDEREHLAAALAGEDATAAVDAWHVLAGALALPSPGLRQEPVPGLHPTRGAVVLVDGQPVGRVGEVDPAVLDRFGIAERVAWLDVDLEAVLSRAETAGAYRPISRFPSSDVDLAFEVDAATPAAAVEATIAGAAGDLLASVALFDVYRGEGVAPGRRSLAYRLRLQAADRTLTDADTAAVRQRAIDAVTASHPAALRG